MKRIDKTLFFAIIFFLLPCSVNAQSFDDYDLFDKHGSVMLVIDVETGAITDANQATVDFYGYSREKLITMNI